MQWMEGTDFTDRRYMQPHRIGITKINKQQLTHE